jgi:hypothetical protein
VYSDKQFLCFQKSLRHEKVGITGFLVFASTVQYSKKNERKYFGNWMLPFPGEEGGTYSGGFFRKI